MSIEKKNISLKELLALYEKDIETKKINNKKEFNDTWPPKKENSPHKKNNSINHYRKPK